MSEENILGLIAIDSTFELEKIDVFPNTWSLTVGGSYS